MGDLTSHGGTIVGGDPTVEVGDSGCFGPPSPSLVGSVKAAALREPGVVLQDEGDDIVETWVSFREVMDTFESPTAYGSETTSEAKEGEPCELSLLEVRRTVDGLGICCPTIVASETSWPNDPCPEDPTLFRNMVLQVVGGPDLKKAKITSTAIIPKGPCRQHRGYVMAVVVSSAAGQVGDGREERTDELPGPDFSEALSARTWWRVFWPFRLSPRFYEVQAACCRGTTRALVTVYPDLHWKIFAKIGQDLGDTTHRRGRRSRRGQTLKVDGTLKHDGGDFVLGPEEFFKKCPALRNLLNKLAAVERKLNDMTDRAGGRGAGALADGTGRNAVGRRLVKPRITPPGLTLEGEWGWRNRRDTPTVEYPVSCKLKADPILGVEVKVDILEWLFGIAGTASGLGLFLSIVRKSLESRGFVLGIDFIASGRIEGDLEYETLLHEHIAAEAGMPPAGKSGGRSVTGTIGGAIEADVIGYVAIDTGAVIPENKPKVRIQAGAEVGGFVKILHGEVGLGLETTRGYYIHGSLHALDGKITGAVYIDRSQLTSNRKAAEILRKGRERKHAEAKKAEDRVLSYDRELRVWDALEIIGEGSRYYFSE